MVFTRVTSGTEARQAKCHTGTGHKPQIWPTLAALERPKTITNRLIDIFVDYIPSEVYSSSSSNGLFCLQNMNSDLFKRVQTTRGY